MDGLSCTRWSEPNDPRWQDNYLCGSVSAGKCGSVSAGKNGESLPLYRLTYLQFTSLLLVFQETNLNENMNYKFKL